VRNNLEDLRATLVDPVYGIVAADHCDVLLDEADISVVGLRVRQSARLAEDLLLVYFAGHGLRAGRRHELYLALCGTDQSESEFTALEYDKLRNAVLDSPATTKIIILDCCFSGKALAGTMADPAALLISQADVNGTYVLTSAQDYGVSLALDGEDYTAFTGRLLGLLRQGIPGAAEYLTVDSLYWHLRAMMAAEGLPEPQRRGTDGADHLALAINRCYDQVAEQTSPPPAVSPVSPRPTADLAAAGYPDRAYLPPSRKSWRDSLEANRVPRNAPPKPDRTNLIFWRFFGLVTGPIWLAFGVWLAREHGSAWPVAAACVPGIASAIGWRLERQSTVRRVLRNLGWVSMILYTVDEFLAAGGWPVRGWIVLSTFLFLLWLFSMSAWTDCRKELAMWEPRAPVAALVANRSWITEPSDDAGTQALAGVLVSIPAARFARLGGTPLSFLAVAGKRLLLVAEVTLPAGAYSPVNIKSNADFVADITSIKVEAERWSTLLSAHPVDILAVALVRPAGASLTSSGLELRVTELNSVTLATPFTFADKAGEFLLADAYELNLDVLALICSSLDLITL
jgi:hypothetical protein